MKHLFTGDIHLGSHGVLQEDISFEVLQWIYEIADQEKVQTLNIAGDIFKSANPRDSVKSFLIQFLIDRKGKDVKTRYLVGNHDYSLKSGFDYLNFNAPSSAVDILSDIKKAIGDDFDVINVPIIIPTDGTCFYYYPFGNNYNELNKRLKSEITYFDKDNMIIVGHVPITNTRFDNNTTAKTGIDIKLLDKSHVYGFFGHFHNHQQFFNSMYCGSPYAQKVNEVGKKGIWLVEMNGGFVHSRTFIENDFSPLFVEVRIDLDKDRIYVYNSDLVKPNEKIAKVEQLLEIMEGNVVDCVFQGLNSSQYEDFIRENEQLISEFHKVSYHYKGIFEAKKADIIIVERGEESTFNFSKEFISFLDREPIAEDMREDIKKKASEVLSEL